MSWSWKTKPRSIIKTVQWFPYFAALEGENWNKKSSFVSKNKGKPVHPVRRSYIYSAHGDEDTWLSSISYKDYLSGQKDTKETEANGRMDKGAFEFFGFGYVKDNGEIAVSEVGNKIVHGTFDDEDYLKQLLKLRLPNYTYETGKIKNEKFIFPFQLVLKAFESYESLNRTELALLFGCDDESEIPVALRAIGQFKEMYQSMEKKNDTVFIKQTFEKVFIENYGSMPNQADSYYDYAEAFSRTLVYTGLFSLSGRSIASKLRVAKYSEMKVKLLQDKYEFYFPAEISSLDEYMQWYGSCHAVVLPWEKVEERRSIISDKATLLIEKIQVADEEYQNKADISLEELQSIVETAKGSSDVNDLKEFENILSSPL